MFEYDDPWKRFKMLLLEQVKYLNLEDENSKQQLLNDIHPHMKEEFFEAGTQVVAEGQPVCQMIFVV